MADNDKQTTTEQAPADAAAPTTANTNGMEDRLQPTGADSPNGAAANGMADVAADAPAAHTLAGYSPSTDGDVDDNQPTDPATDAHANGTADRSAPGATNRPSTTPSVEIDADRNGTPSVNDPSSTDGAPSTSGFPRPSNRLPPPANGSRPASRPASPPRFGPSKRLRCDPVDNEADTGRIWPSGGRRTAEGPSDGLPAPDRQIPKELAEYLPGPVRLSRVDTSPKLVLAPDGMSVTGYKGFRTSRATHGVCAGAWYFEATIRALGPDAAVRFGWSRRDTCYDTPVGFRKNTFGIRDRSGEFLHDASRTAYGSPFGPGDVVGCLIVLARTMKEQDRVRVKEAEMRALKFRYVDNGLGKAPADAMFSFDHAHVEFFINGKSFGVPDYFWREPASKARGAPPDKAVKAALFYPAVSLFKDAEAEVNFGPAFKHPVPEGARGFHEAVGEQTSPAAAPVPGQVPPGGVVEETVMDGNREASSATAGAAVSATGVVEETVMAEEVILPGGAVVEETLMAEGTAPASGSDPEAVMDQGQAAAPVAVPAATPASGGVTIK